MRSHHLRTANPSVGTPYDPLSTLNDLAYGGFFSGGGLSNPINVGNGGDTTNYYAYLSGWTTYGGMWLDPNPTTYLNAPGSVNWRNYGGNTNAKGRIIQFGSQSSNQNHGEGAKFMEWTYAGSNYSPSSYSYKYNFDDSKYYQRNNGSYFSRWTRPSNTNSTTVGYMGDGTPVWLRTERKVINSISEQEVHVYSYPYPEADPIGRYNLSVLGTNEMGQTSDLNMCFSGHQLLFVQQGAYGGSTYVWGYDMPASTQVGYSNNAPLKPMSSSYDALESSSTISATTRWTFPGRIVNGTRRGIVFTGDGIVGNVYNAGDLAYVRLTGVDFAGSGMNGSHSHVRNLSCFDTHGYGQIAMDYQHRTLVHYEYGGSRGARMFFD